MSWLIHFCTINFTLKNTIMSTIKTLFGNWNETKGKIKQQYAILTDDDLLLVEGKEDELIGRLQRKLSKTKKEIHQFIAGL